MQKSDSIKAIAAALLKVQEKLKAVPKNKFNPHFKSRYADLADCLDTLRPLLTENGLLLLQPHGSDGDFARVTTLIVHVASGEFIGETAAVKLAKPGPQEVGSAVTYLRRYGLSLVGLITDEDDDAEAAHGRGGEKQQRQAAPRQQQQAERKPIHAGAPQDAPPPLTDGYGRPQPMPGNPQARTSGPTEAQLRRLFAIQRNSGVDEASLKRYMAAKWNVQTTKALTREQYDDVCGWLEAPDAMADEGLSETPF